MTRKSLASTHCSQYCLNGGRRPQISPRTPAAGFSALTLHSATCKGSLKSHRCDANYLFSLHSLTPEHANVIIHRARRRSFHFPPDRGKNECFARNTLLANLSNVFFGFLFFNSRRQYTKWKLTFAVSDTESRSQTNGKVNCARKWQVLHELRTLVDTLSSFLPLGSIFHGLVKFYL